MLLFLPNLLWLVHNHFPFLEFEQNSRESGSRIIRPPLAFFANQALIMNPALAPLCFGGLLWLLLSRGASRFRFVGWTALLVTAILLLLRAKNYYLSPIYPVLFAAGAVALEHATAARRRPFRLAYAGFVVLSGLLLAPLVMPILSISHFLAYRRLWDGLTPVRFEALPETPLPQYFSDEFGWENMARQTGLAYARLPPAERASTAIFANDYGQAAAIDFFGPRYGLPAAIGKNETYWLWGPRGYTGSTVLVLGSNGKGDREFFRTVQPDGRVTDPYSRADEQFTIFLCRGMDGSLKALWPKIKSW